MILYIHSCECQTQNTLAFTTGFSSQWSVCQAPNRVVHGTLVLSVEGAIELKAYIHNYSIAPLRIVVLNLWVGTTKGSEKNYGDSREKKEENKIYFCNTKLGLMFQIFDFL